MPAIFDAATSDVQDYKSTSITNRQARLATFALRTVTPETLAELRELSRRQETCLLNTRKQSHGIMMSCLLRTKMISSIPKREFLKREVVYLEHEREKIIQKID